MSSQIRETGELELGVLVGDVIHRAFSVRPATLADAYRAAEVVKVPADLSENTSARVAYQMAIDDAQILCQVDALGTLDPVPSPSALFAEIDPDDMAILRQAAADVKKKWRQSRQSLPPGAAPSISLSAPDIA